MRLLRSTAAAIFLSAAGISSYPLPGFAQFTVDVVIQSELPPPPLPIYDQPLIPGPDYIWTPGYWAWDGAGYYWVPGTWALAPQPELLWTPAYWAFQDSSFRATGAGTAAITAGSLTATATRVTATKAGTGKTTLFSTTAPSTI
jgi:WXXGXW repeat (2 copies)